MSFERSRCALRTGAILAFLVPACAALAAAAPPYLVADFNPDPVNGSALPPAYDYIGPQRADLGGVLYFAAADPMHGQELWRSDGTPGGTWLVRDIRPGPEGSLLLDLTVHHGRLYFFADDGVWGLELWTSDGTREGTRLVRDLCPGLCGSSYSPSLGFIASAGDRLYFTAGSLGQRKLWRTDGTREGTRLVVAPCPGCFNSMEYPLVPLPDGRVVFAAYSGPNDLGLWVSDGTPEGSRVIELPPGVRASPDGLIALEGRVLFWASYQDYPHLWTTDGTAAGTRPVRPVLGPPAFDSGPVVWQGSVWFANYFGELWRTDGTYDGTVRVKMFPIDPTPYATPYYPTRLTPMPDGLLFLAGDSEHGMALWRTRGTESTTRPLRDPAPGPDSPELIGLRRAGNRAFFLARNVDGPVDLWVSDGRTAGTRRVATVCQTADECHGPERRDVAGAGGLAFLTVHSKLVGSELWRSDGTAAGTFRVRDIHSGPGSAGVSEIADLNGRAFFGAMTTSAGPAFLWSSDGTAAGTVRLSDVAHWPQDFLRQGDHLYFSGAEPWFPGPPFYLRRQGLWRTDGTTFYTDLIENDLFDLDLLTVDGDLLYLRARDTGGYHLGTGVELWRSNGTRRGTVQVIDLDQQWETSDLGSPPIPAAGSSDPGPPVRLGPVLLFPADDGLSGRELWATDGTAAGTRQVRDINRQDSNASGYLEPGTSFPDSLVRLGGVVLFAADDGLSGRELWVTDGTEAGTRLLRDLRPGAEGSSPHELVELGGAVYFFASAGGPGEALWRTDGTAGGTVQVKSLSRRGLPTWGRHLTPAGGRLFFVADNEAIGPELHVSDGTPAGTRLVLDIRPGPNGSYPQSLTAVDGLLVFAADDGEHGLEPWRSDGTAGGTHPIGDLAPGQSASSPAAFAAAGSLLFFAADDGVHGHELWAEDLP